MSTWETGNGDRVFVGLAGHFNYLRSLVNLEISGSGQLLCAIGQTQRDMDRLSLRRFHRIRMGV